MDKLERFNRSTGKFEKVNAPDEVRQLLYITKLNADALRFRWTQLPGDSKLELIDEMLEDLQEVRKWLTNSMGLEV